MTQEDQQELDALDELSKSLDDEEQMLNSEMVRTQSELDAATADDLATIEQASSELSELEKKAESEETEGQIGEAKKKVEEA